MRVRSQVFLGHLNPRTGETKEWKDPLLTKSGYPSAFQVLELDRDGNLWVGRHDFNGVAKFDKKTEKFVNWSLPKEYENASTKTSFVALRPMGKYGLKIIPLGTS